MLIDFGGSVFLFGMISCDYWLSNLCFEIGEGITSDGVLAVNVTFGNDVEFLYDFLGVSIPVNEGDEAGTPLKLKFTLFLGFELGSGLLYWNFIVLSNYWL